MTYIVLGGALNYTHSLTSKTALKIFSVNAQLQRVICCSVMQ